MKREDLEKTARILKQLETCAPMFIWEATVSPDSGCGYDFVGQASDGPTIRIIYDPTDVVGREISPPSRLWRIEMFASNTERNPVESLDRFIRALGANWRKPEPS